MHWTFRLEGGPKKVNHAAALVGDTLYSFGGYCTDENFKNPRPVSIYALNIHTYRWRTVQIQNEFQPYYGCVPYERYGHTVVEYQGKVYLWGGRNDESACCTVYCFDPVTSSWSVPQVQGRIPEARDGHSACVIGHSMYIFGGFEEGTESFSRDVHAFDFRTNTWDLLLTQGEPPFYRDFHTSTAIGTRLYVFGGRGDLNAPFHSQEECYSNEVMYLDTKTLRWHRPVAHGTIPIGRRSHTAFAMNDKLYIFGGFNGLLEEHYNDLHEFCTKTNTWRLLKPHGVPPCKRRRQGHAVIGKKVIMFGGTSPKQDAIEMMGDDSPDIQLDDHDDMHVLDFEPSLYSLCIMVVIKYGLDQSFLPPCVKKEISNMTTKNTISRPLSRLG